MTAVGGTQPTSSERRGAEVAPPETHDTLVGVWNIVPTPFTQAGAMDQPSLAKLTDFVAGTGVDGMTVLGFMGEAQALDDSERSQVIDTTIGQAAGRLPVCVGVSHAATDRAMAFARDAAARGAHSLMLAPPALREPSDEALRRHFLSVADAVALPIVVQDYPPGSGVRMSVEFIVALATEAPACAHLKLEDDPSPPKVALVHAANPAIGILGGLGGMSVCDELRAGAVGTMTGFGFPEILVEIVRRFQTGDEAGAQEVFDRAAPLIRFENQPGLNLPLRKHVYRRRGAIASERLRVAAPPLGREILEDLDAILRALGLAAHLGPIVERVV